MYHNCGKIANGKQMKTEKFRALPRIRGVSKKKLTIIKQNKQTGLTYMEFNAIM